MRGDGAQGRAVRKQFHQKVKPRWDTAARPLNTREFPECVPPPEIGEGGTGSETGSASWSASSWLENITRSNRNSKREVPAGQAECLRGAP